MRRFILPLLAAGLIAVGSAGASAQGVDVRIRTGDPGYRSVQYHREYVRPRGRVVERRATFGPAAVWCAAPSLGSV
jgi:hypothetical protein